MFGLVPWRKERKARSLIPRTLREEFAPVFERFFGTFPMLIEPWEEMVWPLEITMTEGEKEVVVRTELPGFEPTDIEVTMRGSELIVEAKHGKEAKGAEGKEEREFAHVKRSVTLPEGLELGKIEAFYRNGVLEVHVPRSPEAIGRRIEVKV